MPSVNLKPINSIPTMRTASGHTINAGAQVRNVPTPGEAIAPTPEAVEENEVPQSVKTAGLLRDSFEYVNDLDDEGKTKLASRIRERFSSPTMSANFVAFLLGVTHTRLTRRFPKGTKLSEILEAGILPREAQVEKIVARMSEGNKRELLKKLQAELGVEEV